MRCLDHVRCQISIGFVDNHAKISYFTHLGLYSLCVASKHTVNKRRNLKSADMSFR